MVPASKHHFELPVTVNNVERRLAFVQNPANEEWVYGLIIFEGNLMEHRPVGPFKTKRDAYDDARKNYVLPNWYWLKLRGKV